MPALFFEKSQDRGWPKPELILVSFGCGVVLEEGGSAFFLRARPPAIQSSPGLQPVVALPQPDGSVKAEGLGDGCTASEADQRQASLDAAT